MTRWHPVAAGLVRLGAAAAMGSAIGATVESAFEFAAVTAPGLAPVPTASRESANAPGLPNLAAEPRADARSLDYRLQARELAPGVYVVEGANADFAPANGCNIINTGFIVTSAGVVVINTGPSRLYGEQLRALIARTTSAAVIEVIHLNLHPDYFLGNQAFADVPLRATATTREGMAREATSYEGNLYRLCGAWMRGTAARLPSATVQPGRHRVGGREFELLEYRGHTDSDLVLVDRSSGVAFAGGLVFADRMPTTPHAQVPAWLASLDALPAAQWRVVVPSHGPVHTGLYGIDQTRRYLQWTEHSYARWATQGYDLGEVLVAPVPEEFRRWAAFGTEYLRNVTHLYPRHEAAALRPAPEAASRPTVAPR